jgi:hypothetical protein
MKNFRPPSDFYKRDEQDAAVYFAHRATLRIFGDSLDFGQISETLGLEPTALHRKGEIGSATAEPWPHDMWAYTVEMKESEPLYKHVDTLWASLKPHLQYLLELKQETVLDVFLGYRTNSSHSGLEIPPRSLEMFVQLEIPFGLSVILA